jgi:hypothetical protein
MSCESAVSFRGFSPQESAEICGVLTTTFPAEHWLGITFAKSYEDVGLCGRYVPELGQVTLFDRPDCPDVRHVLAHELGHHIKEKYVDRDLMSRASFGAMIIGYPSVVLTQASQHGQAAEHEIVAEIYREYTMDPNGLQKKAPAAYNWMKKHVFGGKHNG